MRKQMLAIVMIAIVVAASVTSYYVYVFVPERAIYHRTLFYKYLVNDNFDGTDVNYTEYATYKLLGINGSGVLHMLATEELETYMAIINATNGKLIRAYYNDPPYSELSFGSDFYEPMVMFNRDMAVGTRVPLLNYNFTIVSVGDGKEVLEYKSSQVNSTAAISNDTLVYTYSTSTHYMLNGTTVLIYRSPTYYSIIDVQILLISAYG